MKIEMLKVTVRDITKNYSDREDDGVTGYDGKLDIRPKYQREFVYDDEKRKRVIDTIFKGFPLNVMYWCKNDDGTYEVLDGQQRTISFCQYVSGVFAVEFPGKPLRAFHNLTKDEQEKILDYKLMVYVCSGLDSEKLEWFQTINIAGEKLFQQEIRNAVYCGSWVTHAKGIFSKQNGAAVLLGKDYVNGKVNRQDFLKTAIDWISDGEIDTYMSKHQHDQNAGELWQYFNSVITWVKSTFTVYRKEMKNVNWGKLYNEFHTNFYDTDELETEIAKLMIDGDVTKKSGIYPYVLTRKESYLNIRAFDEGERREAYERQKGICPICNKHFAIDQMEADHITPWSEGGKTNAENCQMLCKECNRRKSNK